MSTYAPGEGPLQVGDRVTYVGEPRRFHVGQRKIKPGDTGTIVHDFGWDYRYLIRLDNSTGRRMTHKHCNIPFDIRSGASGWRKAE